jgi:hypothetical protein
VRFRWFPAWAVVPGVLALGVLLFLPGITCPLLLDDYLHTAMIRGTFPARRGPFDLYNFIDDSVRRAFFEQGGLPWWASPNIKLKFFRPLSSALLFFDHTYLERPLLMHLHSLLWWVAVVLAARALFRRLFPERVATLAFVIFALAPCHALPLAWLANRESLVALTFGTLGLASYLRFREEGGKLLHATAATALFALAIFSGEYGLCLGGYIVAFEIFRRGDSPLRRALGLLPFVLPAAAYLVLRWHWEYGARGSGFYNDPFVDVVAFLEGAPVRLLALLGDGWASPDLDTLRPRWIVVPAVVVVVALARGPVRRGFESLPAAEKNVVSFMVVGSVLALLPVVSVVPSSRLLEAPMLGIAGGVATFLDFAWFRSVASAEVPGAPAPHPSRAEKLTGIVAILFGFAHLVRGPLMALVTANALHDRAVSFVEHADFVRDHMTDAPNPRLVVVRATEEIFFLPYILRAEGVEAPRLLALTDASHVLLRSKDAHTINATVPSDTSLVREGVGSLFRDDAALLKKGSSSFINGMRATVLESGEEGPTSVRFAFDEDYSSPDLIWVTTGTKTVRTVEPPEVGFGLPVDP